jgi:hypothetical protein
MIPNTNDLLTQKFDLTEIEPVVAPVDKNIVDGEATDVTNEDALADFKKSRKNLQDILDVGSTAVTQLGILADQIQSPEYFLALSSLIKNVSDVSSNLLKIHKQMEDIKVAPKASFKENHSHLHVTATTKELSEFLKISKGKE